MGANSGCFYYKSVGYDRKTTRQKKFCKKLRSSLNDDKYVIVHQGNNTWHLSNMVIDLPDRKYYAPNFNVMYGSLEGVDSLCGFYDNKYREKKRRALRYFECDEDHVISQVHVYVGEDSLLSIDAVSIPVSSINRIELYNQARGRTFWTWSPLYFLIGMLSSHHSSPDPAPNTPPPTKSPPNVHHGPRGS
jgi:predicted nuclease of restriction endonuclease-like RecB superfamily